jgi:hypothetical protein
MQRLRTFWRDNWMYVLAPIQGALLVLCLLAPPLDLRAHRSATTPPEEASCYCAPNGVVSGADTASMVMMEKR